MLPDLPFALPMDTSQKGRQELIQKGLMTPFGSTVQQSEDAVGCDAPQQRYQQESSASAPSLKEALPEESGHLDNVSLNILKPPLGASAPLDPACSSSAKEDDVVEADDEEEYLPGIDGSASSRSSISDDHYSFDEGSEEEFVFEPEEVLTSKALTKKKKRKGREPQHLDDGDRVSYEVRVKKWKQQMKDDTSQGDASLKGGLSVPGCVWNALYK